jgi:cardiolipin synthase
VTVFYVLAVLAMAVVLILFSLVLFEPGLPYKVHAKLPEPDSSEFPGLLASLVDTPLHGCTSVTLLSGGAAFYEAELDAIARARHSVHLEAYVFHRSAIARRFVDALTERARHGVRVRVVIDAYGSMLTPDHYFSALRAAGGQVKWYQPLRWRTLKRFNNRTHRELIIVDGSVAFIGGAGIAAWWTDGAKGGPPWRDTMVRVDGPLATALQTCFTENWLESSGEVLADVDDFPFASRNPDKALGDADGLVVISTPSAARATRARILFQVLLAASRKSIDIQSPYFLPDRGIMRELIDASKRGVRVRIMVPGRYNNHPLARLTSRRRYGELLSAGIGIHEYQPGMIHSKLLMVDETWVVAGSTNFDNRSFGLNDEVNLAVRDPSLASRAKEQFITDLESSTAVTLEAWRRRSMGERLVAGFAAVLERQV